MHDDVIGTELGLVGGDNAGTVVVVIELGDTLEY